MLYKIRLFRKKKVSSVRKNKEQTKKFYFVADIIPPLGTAKSGVIRFDTFEEFATNQNFPKHVKWILNNTNMSKELIDIADKNPGIRIPVMFDAIKYAEKIGCINTGIPAYMNNIIYYTNEETNKVWLKNKRKDLFKDDNSGEDKK